MHVSLKQARLQRYVCFHPSWIVQGQSFFSHIAHVKFAKSKMLHTTSMGRSHCGAAAPVHRMSS